ncbi:MAG: InlB B-repeat-containing protein [Chitinivibrionia bacterium]|nr:InlB B-repeat-containing protein [Chitinivibrionia bacterium]
MKSNIFLKFFVALAIFASASFFAVGCVDFETGHIGDWGQAELDNRLINSSTNAWIDSVVNDVGYVFNSDGTFSRIENFGSQWSPSWRSVGGGTWHTSNNNQLTLTWQNFNVDNWIYFVHNNNLTVNGRNFVRRSGLNVSITITFNSQGGTFFSPITLLAGTQINLPTPTRNNHTFNGWFTSAVGGTRVGGGGSNYTVNSEITLFAQWTSIGDGGGQVGRDGRLVNSFGEAWIMGGDGFVFHSNGTFSDIERIDGAWYAWNDGTWHTIDNSRLFLGSGGFNTDVYSYSIWGNTLSLSGWTFQRTSGITVSHAARSARNNDEEEAEKSPFRKFREERMARQ